MQGPPHGLQCSFGCQVIPRLLSLSIVRSLSAFDSSLAQCLILVYSLDLLLWGRVVRIIVCKQLLFSELTARKTVQMPVRLLIAARSIVCLPLRVLNLLLELMEFRRLLRHSSPKRCKLHWPPNERANVHNKLRRISQVLPWSRPRIHRFLRLS